MKCYYFMQFLVEMANLKVEFTELWPVEFSINAQRR